MSAHYPTSIHERLSRYILATGMPMVFDLEKSHGSFLFDRHSGEEFLDMFGFFAARPLSFNHPCFNEAEFEKRLLLASKIKPSNCDVYSEEYAHFVETFGDKACGGEFAHLFFIEGGSPAVENALKAAIDWKVRKNLAAGRGEKGTRILHFKQCFHGRTGYALSLTDSPDPRKCMYYPKFDWPRVSNPAMRFPMDADAIRDVEAAESASIKEIHEAFDRYEHDIAGMIIEPIQGEGGDNYFRPEYMQALRKICDEREAMLIFDEVQTGFGTTGRWWDWMNLSVKPDLMVFGKKTQVCGFASTSRVDEVDGVFKVPSRISSTFEGNLSDMVRSTQVIKTIVAENLVENASTMGEYLLKVLNDLESDYAAVTNARGRGLWVAFDLPDTESRDKLVDACFDKKVLVLSCGDRSIRMRPSLDVNADTIGRAGAQIDAALKTLY